MARLPYFGRATPILCYSNWIIVAPVTLCAAYLHLLFFLNAGGMKPNLNGICAANKLPA